MSAGLSGNESDQDGGASGSEEDSDPDRLSVNPPVRREDKKTLQQRRRERLKIEEVRGRYRERVCVCVCVCQRERREADRVRGGALRRKSTANTSTAAMAGLLMTCILKFRCKWVEFEGEKDYTQQKSNGDPTPEGRVITGIQHVVFLSDLCFCIFFQETKMNKNKSAKERKREIYR